MGQQNPFLRSALALAERGLPVFPCWPGKKNPIPTHGLNEATTDQSQIVAWWAEYPNANVAMRTDVVFAVDIDLDTDAGKDGSESLRDWEREHGEIPDTVLVTTPRGGAHYWFRRDDPGDFVQSRSGVLPDVDVRGNGGYVLVPPSVGPNGKRYGWGESFEAGGIASPNDSVRALVAYGSHGRATEENAEPFQVPEKIASGERNETLFRLACSLRSRGLVESELIAAIGAANKGRCKEPVSDKEVQSIVSSALKYDPGDSLPYTMDGLAIPGLVLTKDGRPAKTIHNLVQVMRHDPELSGKLRFDIMSHSAKYFGQLPWRQPGETLGDWTDYDDAALRLFLENRYGLRGKDLYQDALQIVTNESCFNPVADYLNALPPWDGVERIKDLLPDYLGTEPSAYNAAVIEILMLAALKRIFKPGCKYDYLVVLVGPQGCGKSTFLRRLAINEPWLDDNFNTLDGKEAAERLRGKWFLELAELLAVKRQRDVEQIKAFVTTQSDTYRAPYDRRTTDRPRMCVFVGTTNDRAFLSDRTGNRRFLPVEVGLRQPKRDLFADDAAAWFDLCWAEALHKFRAAGENPLLVLPKDLQSEALAQQERFLAEDPWVGQIQAYLDGLSSNATCALDLWRNGLRQDGDLKRSDSNRIHSIMRNDIRGWHEAGRERFPTWGQQIAYQRDGEVSFLPADTAEPF